MTYFRKIRKSILKGTFTLTCKCIRLSNFYCLISANGEKERIYYFYPIISLKHIYTTYANLRKVPIIKKCEKECLVDSFLLIISELQSLTSFL